MGLGDKIKNAGEKASGKAKEAAGNVTDNEKLKGEGKADQVKGDAKQKAEEAKDKLTDN
ncbi:CsbD family protein [Corynebacterium halotolerans]|uniref:CsbD family protein n=1 Tax=Corynebacterium halotolerans TaxID=225326 RepID=UPI003CEFB131